jgi:hypothetical protein
MLESTGMAKSRGGTLTAPRTSAALLAGTLLFVACAGKTERSGEPGANGSDSAVGASGAGTPVGSSTGSGGTGPGVGAHDAGSFAGTDSGSGPDSRGSAAADTGGASSVGGTASAGGSVGEPTPRISDGVECYTSGIHCAPGEQCAYCEGNYLCVPDPEKDPEGYAAATAQCSTTATVLAECDGPEDCPEGEYCTVGVTKVSLKCSPMPASPAGECCLSCFAWPSCTLCQRDADCPSGEYCTERVDWPSPIPVYGCTPGP